MAAQRRSSSFLFISCMPFSVEVAYWPKCLQCVFGVRCAACKMRIESNVSARNWFSSVLRHERKNCESKQLETKSWMEAAAKVRCFWMTRVGATRRGCDQDSTHSDAFPPIIFYFFYLLIYIRVLDAALLLALGINYNTLSFDHYHEFIVRSLSRFGIQLHSAKKTRNAKKARNQFRIIRNFLANDVNGVTVSRATHKCVCLWNRRI